MTLNHSRISDAGLCWRKTFNKYHRRLGQGFSISRTDGTACHAAVAHGLATGDWEAGIQEGKKVFDSEVANLNLLPQEAYAIQDNWEVTELMVKLYQENYKGEELQIIQPECEFKVPLTEQYHNCIWRHWMDREDGSHHWGPPPPEVILAARVGSPHEGREDTTCSCWEPHSVVGKIDGIWKWKGSLWINDHKTTALSPDGFWNQWDLNLQPRIYGYGAWKALGIRPRGFIINAVFKPSEKQVSAWNQKRKYGAAKSEKDYLKYERQAYPLTEEDIERSRVIFLQRAEEWEWRIMNGFFPQTPPPSGACFMYYKDCEFKPLCTTHDSQATLDGYKPREDYDYVEKELYQIAPATPSA